MMGWMMMMMIMIMINSTIMMEMLARRGLGADVEVVALDFSGHGDSRPLAKPCSWHQ
jgi:hypothetical protein